MIEAAKKIAGATDGSGEVKIGEVGTANHQGAAANQASVNGIADGMKEIVDAGGKDALKAAGAAGGAGNAGAGKLFGGTAGDAGGAGDDDIGKAAAAVNAVSGEQILKAIVDAAAGGDNKVAGAAANAATNPIAAAIGTNAQGADFAGGMQNSSDKIAAAIVLRGMAKDGKFSLADQNNNDRKAKVKSVVHQKKMIEAAKKIAGATDGEVKIGEVGTEANKGAAADQASVNGIADGMKEIVAAGGKDALKADGAAGADNKEAGKLFGGANAGNAGGAGDNDIGKAAAAVNAVSGEQILKAIVDAAAGGDKVGAAAGAANNPIAAAIGTDAQGANFGAGMQNSSEKIAAAIVLRGMAKDGKFSLAAQNNNDQKAKVKSEDGRGCKEDCGGY